MRNHKIGYCPRLSFSFLNTMPSWTARAVESLGEAAYLASLVVRGASLPARTVYLLIGDCSLETLESVAGFSTLPNYKAQGLVRSYEALERTLKDAPPLELMISIRDDLARLDELLLLRWPTETRPGFVNLRWDGSQILSSSLRDWLASLGEGVAKTWKREPVSTNQGHVIAHFRTRDTSITERLRSEATDTLRACAARQSRYLLATVSWIGTLECVKRLFEEAALDREPSFPGLLGYGPAGEPEDNVDRYRTVELATRLGEFPYGPAQLWWTELSVEGFDEIRFSIVLTRRRSGARIQINTESTIPPSFKSRIHQLLSSGG